VHNGVDPLPALTYTRSVMDVAAAQGAQPASVDDLDGSWAVRAHPGAVEVAVGDDLVVVRGQAFILNRTASLVWHCLDGVGTLDELVTDLSDVTGTDRDTVEHDVMTLTRELGERGLLDGVAPPRRDDDLPKWTPPIAPSVGDVLDDVLLTQLDGTEARLAELRGRPQLLVHWSPSCGFCVKIASELGELAPRIIEQGVGVVFIAGGSAEDNARVMKEAGIDATVLLKSEPSDVFGAFGTPAAYLLDAEGALSEPMAYGADQVPVLARRLAGVTEADEREDSVATDVPYEGVVYLPAAAAVCGPGGGAQSPGTSWEGILGVRCGTYHLGIRYNSGETAEVLGRLFAGSTVDDPRVPANYAVALYPPGGRSRELDLLVKGASQLVRSRSRSRVLRALLGHLSSDLTERDPALLHLASTAAVRNGTDALLLPAGLVAWVKQLQPRLARRGIQLVDLPWSTVDPATHELVVPEPTVEHDPTVLDGFGDDRLGSELPAVRPGRYPLTAWFLLMPPAEDDGPPEALTASGLVAAAAGTLLATKEEFAAALQHTAQVAAAVPGYPTAAEGPESLVDDLEAVFG